MPTGEQLANSLRILAADSVQQANSGHPGMPMGMADIATVLWRDFLKHNPLNPHWFNRDRFILSNGHGSMLQYALLHLTGYQLSIEELKNFRQLHSKTPGHPEVNETPGIETTSGPLGQGFAAGVGMALAEKILAKRYNREDFNIVDHYTYVFLGDGCLMEGVSHEAASLAAVWGLGKLVAFWDNNGISIDGEVKGWFRENVAERFKAYGWHVIPNIDGHDQAAIKIAIEKAKDVTDRPTLICCKTHIGFGSPHFVDTGKAHGAPLGEDEMALVRKQLDWSYPPFEIPQEFYEAWNAKERGAEEESKWQKGFAKFESAHAELASEFLRVTGGHLPENWKEQAVKWLKELLGEQKALATRKSSKQMLEKIAPALPELLGGSADLTESNCTDWSGSHSLDKKGNGNYIHYGVREFGMSAIMNGVALHRGLLPYGGTFLVFSDYARNAVRLSALMKQRVIFVYTHDSIGLGEDGPTHQPIEQTSSLRLIPNLHVWRPCDTFETMAAWQSAIEKKESPSALLLSRQNLAQQVHTESHIEEVKRGGYILKDFDRQPNAILMATGSEVALAIEAAKMLEEEAIYVRVVSLPCCELFLQQSEEYRERVLPKKITKRVAIEAGVPDYWYRWVGDQGEVIGLHDFGLSAPAKALFEHFDLTVERVVKSVKTILKK